MEDRNLTFEGGQEDQEAGAPTDPPGMDSGSRRLRRGVGWWLTPRGFRGVCLLLAAAALGLRVVGLSEKTLDVDLMYTYEICHALNADKARQVTVAMANGGSYGATPRFSLKHISTRPPLSFALIVAALKIRNNRFMFFLPAALFGAATVGLLAWVGRAALGARVGLIAGLWLLASPPHLAYSQYARYYSFMIFFSLLAYLYLDLWIRMRRWRYLVPWAVVSVLNLGTHYFAVFVVAVQGAVVLIVLLSRFMVAAWKQGQVLRVLLLLATILVLLIGGWASYSMSGLDDFVQSQLGKERARATIGIDVTWAFWRPFLVSMTGWPEGLLPPALALFGLGMVRAWRRNKIFLFHTLALLIVPIVVVTLLQPEHFFDERYVSFALPFYLAAMAGGLATLWEMVAHVSRRKTWLRPFVPAAAAGLVLFAPLVAFREYAGAATVRDLRDVAIYLDRVVRPGDGVLLPNHRYWRELCHEASPRIRKAICETFVSWWPVRAHYFPQRAARPFWTVICKSKKQAAADMTWAFERFGHQAFDGAYVFYCLKHTEIDLGDPAIRRARCEPPEDLSPQVLDGRETFRLTVFVQRSADYYVLVSPADAGCLLRFDDIYPLRWTQPSPPAVTEQQKIWLAEGRHAVTLVARPDAVGALPDFRLQILPVCDSVSPLNAASFGACWRIGLYDGPITYQRRFGMRLHMWRALYYPVFVETEGRYAVGVTSDNDRPTTNRISLWVNRSRVHDFDFGRRDNSLETQHTVVTLRRGLQVIGLRSESYEGVEKGQRGRVDDQGRSTFLAEISFEALDNGTAKRH